MPNNNQSIKRKYPLFLKISEHSQKEPVNNLDKRDDTESKPKAEEAS